MPFVRVTVDRQVLASINTDGKELITVMISGSLVSKESATLSITGGNYAPGGDGGHRIWADQALKTGQAVRIELLSEAEEIGTGRTLEEMYPPHIGGLSSEPPSRAEMLSQFEALSKLRGTFAVRVSKSGADHVTLSPEPGEIGFGFRVLWNNSRKAEASFALHSYSIESIRRKEPGRYASQGNLAIGRDLLCELVA